MGEYVQGHRWSKVTVTKIPTVTKELPTCMNLWNSSHRHFNKLYIQDLYIGSQDALRWSDKKFAYIADFFINELETAWIFTFSREYTQHADVLFNETSDFHCYRKTTEVMNMNNFIMFYVLMKVKKKMVMYFTSF